VETLYPLRPINLIDINRRTNQKRRLDANLAIKAVKLAEDNMKAI
jgi:hypothetical protein